MRTAKGTGACNHTRTLAAAFTVVSCAVALTACGSSGSSDKGSSSNAQTSGIRFASCMRSHGVPNFPDPGPGGGIQIGSSSGINPQSPAFQSAQNSCFKLLGGGGPVRAGSESRKLAMLRLAQCMRRHGISSFPDPTATPPSGPPAGGGIAFGGPGSFIAVPQTMIQSPGFQQAAAACGFPGAGGRRPGKGAVVAAP